MVEQQAPISDLIGAIDAAGSNPTGLGLAASINPARAQGPRRWSRAPARFRPAQVQGAVRGIWLEARRACRLAWPFALHPTVGRRGGLAATRAAFLDRRASDRSIRTEDAAITRFGLQHGSTRRAFIEPLACVRRHGFLG